MDVKTGFFYLFSVVLLFASFRVVTARNPVHAVLFLMLAFSQASGLWLLLQADATVTIAHSRSRDLATIVRTADIVVAAVGRAELIRGEMVKPGAVVIDFGINVRADGSLVGDVAYAEVTAHAGAITPVPGGTGPMTNVQLLENLVRAVTG
jgi:5,10-methylene-tetrahydrofolate dehydrogenase/methenyl tetrahydrofolate cyclohydrolase